MSKKQVYLTTICNQHQRSKTQYYMQHRKSRRSTMRLRITLGSRRSRNLPARFFFLLRQWAPIYFHSRACTRLERDDFSSIHTTNANTQIGPKRRGEDNSSTVRVRPARTKSPLSNSFTIRLDFWAPAVIVSCVLMAPPFAITTRDCRMGARAPNGGRTKNTKTREQCRYDISAQPWVFVCCETIWNAGRFLF